MRKQAEVRPDQLDIADTSPKQPVVTHTCGVCDS
jgi:hypothetical protein